VRACVRACVRVRVCVEQNEVAKVVDASATASRVRALGDFAHITGQGGRIGSMTRFNPIPEVEDKIKTSTRP
jgi:hypothetical protein